MMKKKEELVKHVEHAFEIGGFRYFLNKNTWDLEYFPDDDNLAYADSDLYEDIIRKIKENPNQYIEIETPTSRDDYAAMEGFTEQVRNPTQLERLISALNRPNPFRQFRYALEDTDLWNEWYNFKNRICKQMAKEWVKKNFILFQ
ncbi:UPF0158 family protein [Flexithrix dorotheae]|uniref:UPF0158 family protein n=1 Tax=Flexithrix dorotheae TaxID=70993 RepID=UPI0003A4D574|nr:UPF0158 family protein [Flexithrix dorotheae]